MKKRVAIFANGWSNEYVRLVLDGIQKRVEGTNIDLYTFLNYSSGDENHPDMKGEAHIFHLPDLSKFDGAILLTNVLNLPCERAYLQQEVLKHHIPAVSLEYELEGIPSLGTDTYTGVYELTKHLVEQHDVKRVIYVSGPADNLENQARRQAVSDALSLVNRQIEPDDTIFAEWSYYVAYMKILEWMKSHGDDLPDAFICANDEMALGVYTAIVQYGKQVLEDVIITGCDCTEQSQDVYPVLSTVKRDWDTLGYQSLECIIRQMNGEPIEQTQTFQSICFLGESCGCQIDEKRKHRRRNSAINHTRRQQEVSINEWHLRHIDDIMTHITSFTDLKNQLRWNFAFDHSYEGNDFLIVLRDGFIESDEIPETLLGPNGYTKRMELCCHIENGASSEEHNFFNSKDLVPPLNLDDSKSNSFLFLPLHVKEEPIGYVLFVNHLDIAYQQTLYTWTRHIGSGLERVRQNIRLEELNKKLIEVSMTDALTGLKNRTGYDALAFPLLRKCQKEGKLGSMIFADINRMKQINDKYGHLQGDIALRTVADAIKMTMPPDWIAVRFGGDEFVMVGECSSKEEAEQLKEQLSVNLEKLKEELNLRFPLSASFGAVVMNPEENYSLEEYLRKADESMYLMKQKAHADDRISLLPNFFH